MQSANYWITEHHDSSYMRTAKAIYDPRDPAARGVAEPIEGPVVARLIKLTNEMPAATVDRERLIANAEAWKLMCPELRAGGPNGNGVPVSVLAEELVVLDAMFAEGGITKEDFDIKHSFNRVRDVAPNISKVCQASIEKSIGRLNLIPGEGTEERRKQQHETVLELLKMSGQGNNNKSATNEPTREPYRGGWDNRRGKPSQRRGASGGHWSSSSDRDWSGGSARYW